MHSKKTILFFFALLLCISAVQAMDYSFSEGFKVDSYVYENFKYADLKVVPELAEGHDRTFEQNITIKNTYGFPIYIYFDAYYNNTLVEIKNDAETYKTIDATKSDKTYGDTTGVVDYSSTDGWAYTQWGNQSHYLTQKGKYLEVDEEYTFSLNYITNDDSGKYNVRIWANTIDDWQCILDSNANCIFDYTIDPTYLNIATGAIDNNLQIGRSNTIGENAGFQSFNVTCTTATCSINYINLTLLKVGTPTGIFDLGIYNITVANASQPNLSQKIANFSINVSVLTTAYTNITFNFTLSGTPSLIVTKNVKIAALFNTTTTSSSTNYVQWARRSGANTYTGGNSSGCYNTPPNSCTDGATTLTHDMYMSMEIDTVTASTDNYTLTVNNLTWITPANETFGYNFTLNVTVAQNVSNISAALNYNGTILTSTKSAASGSGNNTQYVFNVSGVRAPLVSTNATMLPFNWSITTTLTNATNITGNSSSTNNQTVIWAYYPELLDMNVNATEGSIQNIDANSTVFGNVTDVTFEYRLQYNNTNNTGGLVLINNSRRDDEFNVSVPMLSGGQTNVTVGVKEWLNITFNGSTILRTYNTSNQTIWSVQNNYTLTINNLTWTTPANETFGYNFTLNLSVGQNVTNVSAVLNYNNSIFSSDIFATSGSGNNTQYVFNSSQIRAPLITTNTTMLPFNWTITSTLTNGTNISGNVSATNNQTIIWAFYPEALNLSVNVTEGVVQTILANSTQFGNMSDLTVEYRLQYNNTNNTGVFLPPNTSRRTDMFNVTVPFLFGGQTNVTVNVKEWLNLTFNGLNLLRTFNTSNQTIFAVSYNLTITVQNISWVTPALETSNYKFTINISYGNNTNVTQLNLSYNNVVYQSTLQSSGMIGANHSWKVFNVSLRPDLVIVNNTGINFNWTFYDPVSNTINYTATNSQFVLWAFYPESINYRLNVTETENQTWQVNFTSWSPNVSGVTFGLNYTQWNITNVSGSLYGSSANRSWFNYSFTTLFLYGANDVISNATINITPYVNITFNGTTLFRKNFDAIQTVNKMILTNCSTITSTLSLNFTIRDAVTNALVNANSVGVYTVHNDTDQTRTHTLLGTGTSNPQVCIWPTFARLIASISLTNITATGYAPNSFTTSGALTNVSQNFTIFLVPNNNSQVITYHVVDTVENPLSNYTIKTFLYFYGNGSTQLVSTVFTDGTGSSIAFVVPNNYYKWEVYNPTGSLVLTEGPSYLLNTTTSKTFIIQGNFQTGLESWYSIYGLDCSVTWNNATNHTSTSWTTSNISVNQFCFNLFNISNAGFTIFNQTCSSNMTGALSIFAGYNNTQWLSYPTLSIVNDSTTYILYCNGTAPLSFNTVTGTVPLFSLEGVFWAMILLVLVVTIGLMGEGAEYIAIILVIAWTGAVSLFNLIPFVYSTIIGITAFLVIYIMGLRRERG